MDIAELTRRVKMTQNKWTYKEVGIQEDILRALAQRHYTR